MVKDKKENKKISLSNQFVLYNNLLLAIVLIVSIGAFSYFFYIQLMGRFRDKVMDVAESAAIMIDVNKHETLHTRQDENSADYKEIKTMLQKFQKANIDVTYIYTMRKTNKEGTWQFVVDAADGKDMSHIGDPYDVSEMEEMKKAFDGPAADTSFEKDQWGRFLSGYAPIRDKNGNAVAIVGVDIKADTIINQELSIIFAGIIILIVVLIVSTLSSRYLAAQFFKPVSLIKEKLAKTKGQMDLELFINSNNEFAELVSIINSSAEQAATTHNNLKKELDSTKKEKYQFHQIYSDLIKELTGGKLRLATPSEMEIYLSDGAQIDEIEIREEADREKVSGAMEKFRASFGDERFQTIGQALSEAVENVIKHAREGKLIIKNFEGKLRFVISDKGPGMSLNQIPQEIIVNKDSSDFPDKGFALLYKSADYIIFTSSKSGTIIVMDFSLGNNSEPYKNPEAAATETAADNNSQE